MEEKKERRKWSAGNIKGNVEKDLQDIKAHPLKSIGTIAMWAIIVFALLYPISYADNHMQYCSIWYGQLDSATKQTLNSLHEDSENKADYLDKVEMLYGGPNSVFDYSYVAHNWVKCKEGVNPTNFSGDMDKLVGIDSGGAPYTACGVNAPGLDGHQSIKIMICQYDFKRWWGERW